MHVVLAAQDRDGRRPRRVYCEALESGTHDADYYHSLY